MRVVFLGQNSRQALSGVDPTNAITMLAKHGIEATDLSDTRADALVCVDLNSACLRELRRTEYATTPKILIRFEPAVVLPQHARKDFDSLFDEIFEIGRSRGGTVLPWPQTWDTRNFGGALRDRRIIAVSANKSSAMRGELYSLRRSAYSTLSNLDVFGNGWLESRLSSTLRWSKEALIVMRWGSFPSLKTSSNAWIRPVNSLGPCKDKIQTMAQYKVALVIENSLEYMSEKLIDALLAGCIPVYVGPDVQQFNIPERFVVQAKPTLESIQEACDKALQMDWATHFLEVERWRRAPEVRHFWTESAFLSVAKILKERFTL